MLQVDKGVLLPASRQSSNRAPKYPWKQMSIGDSFFVPVEDMGRKEIIRKTVLSCAFRQKPMKFATRMQANGIRVWRIE